MKSTRRAFLASVGAVVAIRSTSGNVAATEPPGDSPAESVSHITEVRDGVDELKDYAPKLHVPTTERRQTRADTTGQYGWVAESEVYDVTAYYYWTRYKTQRSSLYYVGLDIDGISIPFTSWSFGADSHHLDHEPTIVFVEDDGTVDSVVTTGGHHYSIEIDGEMGNLTEDKVSDRRTHANLTVVRPWNHYVETPSSTEGSFVDTYAEFGSWLDKRDSWYRNGRYDSTAEEAIEDPFVFYDDGSGYRNHWWESGTRDAWFGRNVWNRLVERDTLRIEE